jgi:hypothetical protein
MRSTSSIDSPTRAREQGNANDVRLREQLLADATRTTRQQSGPPGSELDMSILWPHVEFHIQLVPEV